MANSQAVRKSVLLILLLIATAGLLHVTGIAYVKKEHVIIRNSGVKLAATLSVPRWADGPHAAVILIHESGRVRRQDVRYLSRKFVREGLAVLTYDKRGVAKSTGVFTALTVENSHDRIEELAEDASAAVDFLREHPVIDGAAIGLIGEDQASWIMPYVVSINQGVSFFVVVSGSAVTFGELDFYRKLTGQSPGPYEEMADGTIADRLAGFGGPFGYDPAASLTAVEVPSLWLLGERDDRTPVDATVSRLAMLQADSLFDVRVLPGHGHDLLGQESGAKDEVLSMIVEWLSDIGVFDFQVK